ncbi:hypothetical protein E3N88_35921 [Mikania micrantha]|uniref:Ionotropic glutamate receptor C-terminal domain-containing protein n=1 Tax=Mikania micrantha TaxID=192012 RepID=A0A5N6M2T3_9ASTR|nr:hypothetical protein E3N88_35921 [Mikania micrantha]
MADKFITASGEPIEINGNFSDQTREFIQKQFNGTLNICRGVLRNLWKNDANKTLHENMTTFNVCVPKKQAFHEFVDVDEKEQRIGGFSIAIFCLALQELSFKIQPIFVPIPDESYTEIVKKFAGKECDVVAGDFTIISSRTKYAEFTIPYMSSEIYMLVPATRKWNQTILTLMKPFTIRLWIEIYLACILIGIAIGFLEYREQNPSFYQAPFFQKLFMIIWYPVSKIFLQEAKDDGGKYMKVGPIADEPGLAFAFPLGYPLRQNFSAAVVKVTESQDMIDMKRIFFENRWVLSHSWDCRWVDGLVVFLDTHRARALFTNTIPDNVQLNVRRGDQKFWEYIRDHHVPDSVMAYIRVAGFGGVIDCVLACLYRNLCKGTSYLAKEISGPMFLLQMWAWERITCTSPILYFDFDSTNPYGARWRSDLSYSQTIAHVVKGFRSQLTALHESMFKWAPYDHVLSLLPPICTSDANCWRCETFIIYWEIVEYHAPSRVSRKFNILQKIPNALPIDKAEHKRLHALTRQGKANKDWRREHHHYIQEWDGRFSNVLVGEFNFVGVSIDYNQWFWERTVLYITNPGYHEVNPHGYQNHGGTFQVMVDGVTQMYQMTGNLIGTGMEQNFHQEFYTPFNSQIPPVSQDFTQENYFPPNQEDSNMPNIEAASPIPFNLNNRPSRNARRPPCGT